MKSLLASILVFSLSLLPSPASAALEDQIKEALTHDPALLGQVFAGENGQKLFNQLLAKALENHPELVLDVLERHADTVFTTAQKGAALQKRKAFYARWKNDAKMSKELSLEHHALRGDEDAPVTIAVFSDFTCAYCDMTSKTLKALQKKMPGAFRYAFMAHPARNNPGAMLGVQWFTAASLRDPQKAWTLYEKLFAGADKLLEDPEPFLRSAAREAGFDPDVLASEAAGRRVADIIASDMEEAKRLGVSGTPYLFVNDLVIPGAPDEGLLREAVERAAALKKGGDA